MYAQLLQSCLTLCDPVDRSPPASSVHGVLPARILEWVAMLSSGVLPNPGMAPRSPATPALQADSLSLHHRGNSTLCLPKPKCFGVPARSGEEDKEAALLLPEYEFTLIQGYYKCVSDFYVYSYVSVWLCQALAAAYRISSLYCDLWDL